MGYAEVGVREGRGNGRQEVDMPQLTSYFEKACSNVEPEANDVSNASAAHQEVRDALHADETLASWKIDSCLIGSYDRHVSIRRIKDVDVLCRLPEVDTSKSSRQVLGEVVRVLRAKYDTRVEPQDRSVKVQFPDFDLHVDAVPARPCGDDWEIPDHSEHSVNWQKTNPLELATLTTTMNAENAKLYVPVVKLVRQTRRANLGKRPGGLYFEILTYHAFAAGCSGSLPERYVGALASIADQLEAVVAGGDVEDPSMEGEVITVRATDQQMRTAATVFRGLASRAQAALDSKTDECRAAAEFRAILGQRSDDNTWVFDLPEYCNEDGTTKYTEKGLSYVPGEGRFA
jgi:hypothetical protein